MGMGVLLAGTPVRRPAGVSHPGPHQGEVPVAPGEGPAEVLEVPHLSYLLYPTFPLQGQPRRVVTPILQVPKTLQKYIDTPLFAGVTHYAAHGLTSPFLQRWDQGGQRKETGREPCVRARTVLCPRRHRRDLSPP